MKKKAVILEGNAVSMGDVSWDPVCELCDTVIYPETDEQSKWDRMKDAELVLTNKVILDEAVFEKFPQISYVGVCATGYNVVDLEAAARRNITVTNIPAYSTESVVQHTFGLILDLASKITLHDASVKQGDWVRASGFCYTKAPVMEIAGKTLGIFGFGHIGQRVAEIARSFGMNVLVHTAHPDRYLRHIGPHLRFGDTASVFSCSDIVSFHCPLTEETKGIVCRSNLDKMRDGAILINVSRGELVCEQDLADALESGKLSGAGVDVVSKEPMDPENPLLNAPNIIITPHIAWASREARTRLVDVAAENIRAYLSGTPRNVVN